jgi:hypothetical protein
MLNALKIEEWMEVQVPRRWPGARVRQHEERDGDLYFPLRHDGRDFWLVVEGRAFRGLAHWELAELLDQEDWLRQLLTEKCLCVRLPRLHPELTRVPDLVI